MCLQVYYQRHAPLAKKKEINPTSKVVKNMVSH